MAKHKQWHGLQVRYSNETFQGPVCKCGNNQYQRMDVSVKSLKYNAEKVRTVFFKCNKCNLRTPYGRMTDKEEAAYEEAARRNNRTLPSPPTLSR